MNRREWLRGATQISAGVVAADQLELLDRLGWKRRFFAGADFTSPYDARRFSVFAGGDFTVGDLISNNTLGGNTLGVVMRMRPLTIDWGLAT